MRILFNIHCKLECHSHYNTWFHLYDNQATEKLAFGLLSTALILAFLPTKCIVLLLFFEIFTRYSPPRKASTERLTRRLKEWWFSIPAAPVTLERDKEEKKRK